MLAEMPGAKPRGSSPATAGAFPDIRTQPLWPALVSLALAVTWLLPNHTQPWTAFHSEAWAAVALCLIAWVVLFRNRQVALSALDLLIAAAALLPVLHYAAGLVPFAGQAWMSSTYLLGFLLAILCGRMWNAWRPQAMADLLFPAFLLASIASVGLQVYQWMGLAASNGVFDIWVASFTGHRPYGNLAQPNQLATLHLWGLLACGWCVYSRQVRAPLAVVAGIFILFGLALTQSRSGFVGLLVLSAAAWRWRALWPARSAAYAIAALLPVYLLTLGLGWLSRDIMSEAAADLLERTTGDTRLAVWAMFLDAIAQRPWFGYGWDQTLAAHLAMVEHHDGFADLYAQAHNLGLDLVVWAGIPLGVGLSLVLLAWTLTAWRRVETPRQALLWLVLAVVVVHAALELPLHYTFFLLPVGLVMGALSNESRIWLLAAPGRGAWKAAAGLQVVITLLLGLIVCEYLKVEASTTELRFKLAKIHNPVQPQPPDLILLNQFRAMLQLGLAAPAQQASDAELTSARDVTAAFITYPNLDRLVRLLALNGHVPEAKCWAYKAEYLLREDGQRRLRASWDQLAQEEPALGLGPWPALNPDEAICGAVASLRLGPYPPSQR